MATDNAERLEQRYDVAAGSELSVSNVSGSISVHAEDTNEIVVRYNKRGSSKSIDNTQVQIERSGNRVTVQTRSGTSGLINFGRSSSVSYDITVPRDCAVRLHAVSSDIVLEGPRADTGVQSVSGDIRVRDVAGDITMSTVSGNIDASNLVGTLVARSTSGDARIMTSRLRRFSVNSVSGDFTVETPLNADEHCNAKTVSGDLELLVPPETGATVQLKSISGSVSCELPAEIIKAGRRHWQGRINGGGGHVEMNSVSGDLQIRRSGSASDKDSGISPRETDSAGKMGWTPKAPIQPVQPVQAVRPIPPVSPRGQEDITGVSVSDHATEKPEIDGDLNDEDMSAILAALERGEISVEDAMAKL